MEVQEKMVCLEKLEWLHFSVLFLCVVIPHPCHYWNTDAFGSTFSTWSYKLVSNELDLSSLRDLHLALAREMARLNMHKFVFSSIRIDVLCP